MADRGILFSAPMVRALIAGTKTQDRRALRPLRGLTFGEAVKHGEHDGPNIRLSRDQIQEPRIRTGDRLYVREHWHTSAQFDHVAPRDLDRAAPVGFAADNGPNALPRTGRFRQGMHMPRWASRITLHVTDVRVQRLQDISRDDAIAEGIERVGGGVLRWEKWATGIEGLHGVSPEAAYALLWEHINGPGSWEANPWVSATTFTVELANIDSAKGAGNG